MCHICDKLDEDKRKEKEQNRLDAEAKKAKDIIHERKVQEYHKLFIQNYIAQRHLEEEQRHLMIIARLSRQIEWLERRVKWLITPYRYLRTVMGEMEERGVLGAWCIVVQIWLAFIILVIWCNLKYGG